MEQNLGTYDIIIRLIVGLTLIILLWVNELTTTVSWILLFFSFLLLTTGLSGSCPIYRVLQISTRKAH
ncbi:YgaP family membrane protein [Spirosoma litoris]